MDAAKKKALFRAKLNSQKKDKRIDSPLVRYNEFEQPVCRVCNVVLKSEFQWDAHQASQKHHQAIDNVKSSVKSSAHMRTDPQSHAESTRPKHPPRADFREPKSESYAKLPTSQSSSVLPADFFDNNDTKSTTPKHDVPKAELPEKRIEPSKVSKLRSSSALPPDFFDNHAAKKQKSDALKSLDPDSYKSSGSSFQTKVVETGTDGLPSGSDTQSKNTRHAKENVHSTTENAVSGTKAAKGALPEGFFDDKEADLLARGIKPVKPDVKDEYKEFEKLIREDLQEVDARMEEEEIDAAEMIEEAESLEQRAYREKVELLRTKRIELMAARSAKCSRDFAVAGKKYSQEESSSDDDDDDNDNDNDNDENFAVDWRAQHL